MLKVFKNVVISSRRLARKKQFQMTRKSNEVIDNMEKKSTRKRKRISSDESTDCQSVPSETNEDINTISKRMRRNNEDDNEPILIDISFENHDMNDDVDIEIATVTAPEESETDKNVEILASEKKRNKFLWRIVSEWDDLDAALEFLESEGFVSYDYSDLKCGQKFYFRCKSIPKEHKTWCGMRYTLFHVPAFG